MTIESCQALVSGKNLRKSCQCSASLVPRPSLAPVFDRLQYAKTEPEGLVNLTT